MAPESKPVKRPSIDSEESMPLKLRIKPEGKLFINGVAVAKNIGNHPIDLLILTEDQVSRTQEHADGVAKALGRQAFAPMPLPE